MSKQLEWLKPSKYYMTTRCGKYNVAKAIVGVTTKYTAWRNKHDKYDNWPKKIGDACSTADQAKQICQLDADTGGGK